jgi:hypothetical protein
MAQGEGPEFKPQYLKKKKRKKEGRGTLLLFDVVVNTENSDMNK